MLMEHPQYSICSIFPNMTNISEIFTEHVEEIKSFKLGPSATISNLTFRIELMRNLKDKKVLMEYPQYSYCSIFPNLPNISDLFLELVGEIESFKLGPSATISKLAFRIELMRKLKDKKVLMEHYQSKTFKRPRALNWNQARPFVISCLGLCL